MGKEKKLSESSRIGDFKVGKTIGQGAFSKVKLGYHKDTGQKVAIKIIDKKMMAEKLAKSDRKKEKFRLEREAKRKEELKGKERENLNGLVEHNPRLVVSTEKRPTDDSKNTVDIGRPEVKEVSLNQPPSPEYPSPSSPEAASNSTAVMDKLFAEVKLLMRLDHPNIIALYQMIDTEAECFIIMEYATGGELIDYIAARDHLSEKEARKFFRQIISAIDHCHQGHVVHRDLKLENLLLSSSRDILITDFGLGRTFDYAIDEMMTFCGTPNYAAVELVTFKPYLGVRTDIWAMGVILFIMCSGKPPFQGHSIPSLYNKIINIQYTCPDYFSPELKHLLSRILVKHPNERITMEELFSDPWVNFEEIEMPPRIPSLYSNVNMNGMEQILGINSDTNCTAFTFSRFKPDSSARTGHKSEKESEDETIMPFATRRKGSLPIRRFSIMGPRQSISTSSNGQNHITLPKRTLSTTQKMRGADSSLSSASNITSPMVDGISPLGALDLPKPNSISMDLKRQRRFSYHAGATTVTPNHMRTTTVDRDIGTSIHHPSPPQPRPFQRVLDPFNEALDSLPETSPLLENAPSKGHRRLSVVPVADGILYNLPSGASPVQTASLSFHLTKPTDKAIQDFHMIHRPPKSIRSLRFTFTNTTTSSKPPSAIFQDVHRVLLVLQQQYPHLNFHREDDYYMFTCKLPSNVHSTTDRISLSISQAAPTDENSSNSDKHCPSSPMRFGEEGELVFEIEVCKVWLLKIHGVRIKRISGDPLFFKDIYKDICSRLNLG